MYDEVGQVRKVQQMVIDIPRTARVKSFEMREVGEDWMVQIDGPTPEEVLQVDRETS